MTWKPLTRPRSNKWTDLLCKRTSSHKWNTKSEIKKKKHSSNSVRGVNCWKEREKKEMPFGCVLLGWSKAFCVCEWVQFGCFRLFVCWSIWNAREHWGPWDSFVFFLAFCLGVTWNGFRLAVAWETVRFFEWKTRCASSVKNVQRNVCLWGDSQGNWHLEGSYAWCLPSLPSFFVRHVETCQFQ